MSQTPTTTIQSNWVAILFIIIAALCFSTKAIFIKLAYQYDVSAINLLALRMAFSIPIYLLILGWSSKKGNDVSPISSNTYFKIIGVGILGYYVASLLDFTGLQYIPASLERLLLFSYPTWVLLIGYFFLKKPITSIQLLALGITYIGISVIFTDNQLTDISSQFWYGVLLIFLCSIAYALHLIGSGELLPKVGTLRFTVYAMTSAGAMVLLHHFVVAGIDLFHFPTPVYWAMFATAVIATVIPSFMISEGIRIIGANNASIISSFGPVSTIIMAYLFLGERLTLQQWIGGLIVIAGVLLISLTKK